MRIVCVRQSTNTYTRTGTSMNAGIRNNNSTRLGTTIGPYSNGFRAYSIEYALSPFEYPVVGSRARVLYLTTCKKVRIYRHSPRAQQPTPF